MAGTLYFRKHIFSYFLFVTCLIVLHKDSYSPLNRTISRTDISNGFEQSRRMPGFTGFFTRPAGNSTETNNRILANE